MISKHLTSCLWGCSKPHVEAAIVYEIQASGVLLFVPKYHIKGAVQLADRAGRPIPLLKGGTGDDLNDPFLLAERQKLTIQHGTPSALYHAKKALPCWTPDSLVPLPEFPLYRRLQDDGTPNNL